MKMTQRRYLPKHYYNLDLEGETLDPDATRQRSKPTLKEEYSLRPKVDAAGDAGIWHATQRKLRWVKDTLKVLDVDTDSWINRLLKTSHSDVFRVLHKAQICLAVFVALLTLIVPEIRQFFVAQVFNKVAFHFGIEFLSWAILASALGRSRLPVNYASLVVMRLFLALAVDESALAREADEVKRFKESPFIQATIQSESKIWGVSSFLREMGRMIVNTFNPYHVPEPEVMEAKVPGNNGAGGSLLLLLLKWSVPLILLGMAWLLTKFSKIRVHHMHNIVLLSNFFCTTMGTLILLSSVMLKRLELVGMDAQLHLDLCKGWFTFSMMVVIFMGFFMAQRLFLRKELNLQKKGLVVDQDFLWICLEGFTFVFQIQMLQKYIPRIHNDTEQMILSLPKSLDWIMKLIPGTMKKSEVTAAMIILPQILEQYFLAEPEAMQIHNQPIV